MKKKTSLMLLTENLVSKTSLNYVFETKRERAERRKARERERRETKKKQLHPQHSYLGIFTI